jgi:N-ethylmaleimide reductase
VRRLRENAPQNALDKRTLYGGGARGYVDYPTLDEAVTT